MMLDCPRAANFLIALVLLATMSTVAHAETVTLYAAGSLKAALTDVARAYEAHSGHTVAFKFGPAGLLKNEIIQGATAGVFASANMEHPRALHAAGKSGPVRRFARNALCALARPGLALDDAMLLERMLDPDVKLATSTPKADPSGDYAFEVFARAEALKPGARAALEGKALKLTGAKDSAVPPGGKIAYGWHIAEGRADIFLTYCTNALQAQAQYPGQQRVALPDALAVGADYGLTVLNSAPGAANELAAFILSSEGQTILTRHGFAPGT
jgi:molybdenum ABC transporter molybdate-binding protein